MSEHLCGNKEDRGPKLEASTVKFRVGDQVVVDLASFAVLPGRH